MVDGIYLGVEHSKQLPGIRQIYDRESMEQITKNLYEKVQGIMKQQKIKELIDQKSIIQDGKTTILEKILGKEKLKNEQMRWIDLQIMNLAKQPVQRKENYSIREMLVEMKAFSSTRNANSLPIFKMKELEANVYQVFGYTREQIDEIARTQIQQKENLPIEVKGKTGLFQIGRETKMLKMQNDRLDIELRKNSPNQQMRQQIQVKQNSVSMFKSKLQTIGMVIKDKSEIQKDKEKFHEESLHQLY